MKRRPETLERFGQQWPAVWRAYLALRESCDRAGPLDQKTVELIKLAIEVGKHRHGGLIAHIHRAQAAGASREDILHAVALALPLVGFPNTLDSFKVVLETLTPRTR